MSKQFHSSIGILHINNEYCAFETKYDEEDKILVLKHGPIQ